MDTRARHPRRNISLLARTHSQASTILLPAASSHHTVLLPDSRGSSHHTALPQGSSNSSSMVVVLELSTHSIPFTTSNINSSSSSSSTVNLVDIPRLVNSTVALADHQPVKRQVTAMVRVELLLRARVTILKASSTPLRLGSKASKASNILLRMDNSKASNMELPRPMDMVVISQASRASSHRTVNLRRAVINQASRVSTSSTTGEDDHEVWDDYTVDTEEVGLTRVEEVEIMAVGQLEWDPLVCLAPTQL